MVTICLGELWMLTRVRASSSKNIYKNNYLSSQKMSYHRQWQLNWWLYLTPRSFNMLFWPRIFLVFSRKISAESYFKITHFGLSLGLPFIYFILFHCSLLFYFIFILLFSPFYFLFILFLLYFLFVFILISVKKTKIHH